MQSEEKERLSEYYGQNAERILREWGEFLRFKSISTDPAHVDDCVACATWLARHLEAIGFSIELIPTSAKPIVYAAYQPEHLSGPTVLFYGHYDVQPTDPQDAWKSPPFEPTVREDRIFARGAQDNKGQLFYVVKAVEALIKDGELRCPVKFLIEGEEEDGSRGITETLPQLKSRVKADVLMVCDTGTLAADVATITMGLRGLITMELMLKGAGHDLHSGVFGGVVPNPATEMARLIATLHDPSGKIAVEGYLDDLTPVSEEDRKLANDIPVKLEMLESVIGVPLCGGEHDLSPIERRGFRPTIEVNGLHSGYGGPGTKTIIPSFAIAKLTSRLCGGQSPARCLDLLEAHVKKHAPRGLKLEITAKGIGGPALLVSSSSPVIKIAKEVLDKIAPLGTCHMWEGASIPIIPALAETAGAEPLLVGFGLEEDRIHAPNESFSLDQFRKGFLYAALLMLELSRDKR